MRRALGFLVVAGLIGGAVWIGLRSERPAPPSRVDDVHELARILSEQGFGCGHVEVNLPGLPPADAEVAPCTVRGTRATLYVFEESAASFADRYEMGTKISWVAGENWVVVVDFPELAIGIAGALDAEALYDPSLLAGAPSGSRLECPEGDMIQVTSVLIGGPGFIGSPEDAVGEALDGLRATDVLVATSGASREVRIYRADKLIGTASIFRSPKGGWLVDGSTVCASSHITH